MIHNTLPYRLGLPAWAFSGWKNKYFSDKPSSLASYASVFNMVEGNTTFYQLPTEEKVATWQESLAPYDCKICFKLPQTITHAAQPDWDLLDTFINRISPLQAHLGPLLLVFPAKISPSSVGFIDAILQKLPSHLNAAVEVRHPDFFNENDNLQAVLDTYQANRVVLDSRPLYRGDQSHPDVVQAKHEKPNVPVSPKVYNKRAFVRLVLHPDSPDNQLFIEQWGKMVVNYLQHDIEPFISIHCPNNFYCPSYALALHQSVQRHANNMHIADLPPFPVPQQSNLL
jgi:uncharacterized protein YecE (DUF72 family)